MVSKTRAEASTASALPNAIRFRARSGADQLVDFELNSRLAVGVDGEVCMKQGKRPRPVRSVQYGSIAVRIDLYEYVAVPHGPDVLRIALRKVPRVRRRIRLPGPVGRERRTVLDGAPRPVPHLPGARMSDVHDKNDGGHHHERPASRIELRARALEALLVERGLVSTDAIDAVIELYENEIGPQNGAKVVARAWVEPAYRERLLADGAAAIAELGFGGAEGNTMVVVPNGPGVHNAVVCTLCSCYPWPVLGLPPSWYKSAPYRARMVSEPHAVLREFGLELPATTTIRVWDSTAEVRYLVLPERPSGTDGWDEEELATIVTRDAMIGVAVPVAQKTPA